MPTRNDDRSEKSSIEFCRTENQPLGRKVTESNEVCKHSDVVNPK